MKLRKKFIPNDFGDICSLIFLLTVIPIIYYFELFVVLPSFYDCSSLWFIAHFLCGTFTMFNVVSNYIATILIDSSVNSVSCTDCSTEALCSVCEIPLIARAWHCPKCGTCISKRDHHCVFVGYCIGHFNHRYFIWLLFYLFIGTFHSSYLNVFFLKENFSYNPYLIVKLIFPLTFLLLGFDGNVNYCHLFIILLSFVGLLVTGVLLFFHSKLILNGTTCHENARNDFTFHIGRKGNIVRALGERWYLTWISAFVESKLLEDGVQWNASSINNQLKTL